MSAPGWSPTVRKETFHTVSLVLPQLRPGTSVLDIGCGAGWVADELTRRTLRLSVERIEAGLAGDSAADQGRNG